MRERKNHYSIRKLTIGVASVLIGISFFGIKADTVQAETSNSNESISQESEQTNANTSESAQDETITIKPATTERQDADKPLVVEAKAAKTDLNSNSLYAARTVKQDSESKVKTPVTETQETKLTADSPSNSTTSNVQEDRTDPAANRDKIGKEAPSASATFGKNSTLTIDHGQLDEKQKTAKLTMNSANFQAGDTYTITIPKKGGLSLGTTDVAVLAPVFGKTTFTETIDYYKIEDHFINGGTITQNINLHYDQNINPLASMTNTITVDTTGSAEKHASLKVTAIGKEPELSADLVHVPQPIINGQEFTTRPALTLGTPLKDFNQVDLNLALDKNYKLTNITLNDEDQSLVLTPDQLTIDANNVAHIVLNEEQITSLLKGQSNHFNFKITGHFDIPASDFVNKKYHAKFLDKDKSTISGTIVNVTTKPSHIGTITGTGVDDLTIYPTVKDIDWAATVNYLTEYTAHNKDNPGKDTSGVMVVDGKASSTTDMHYFTLSNQSTLDITDANLTVDLPDGYNVPATLTLSENTIYQDQDPDNINFIVSYVDGTSAVITPDQFGNTLTFHVTPNKKIRSLNVRIAQWNPDVEYDLSSKHGTYSKTYANGKPVLVGDLLTTKTTLSSPSFNGEVMMPMTTVIDRLVNKVKEGTFTAVYPAHQTSTVPGEKNAGTMTYETCVSGYGHPMLKHPITYIMVPDNAEVADLSKVTVKYSGAYVDYQPLLTPKSVSVITVDGHRFIKCDCSNYDLLEDGLNVTVPYSNAPDVQNSTKPTVFFTVADNLKNGNLNDPDHTVAQALKDLVQKEKIDTSKVVYNGSKAGYPGSWIINTVEGMSSATMVSGNTSGISTLATQDVHGINPDQMKIYGSIINATNNQVANAYQIINIPDSQDKVSQFTPTMSGQASLIDAVNGTDLSSAGELLYSTALTDLNNAQAAAADGHWLTADQITNWSKVKSVMFKFDSKALPARTSARVEIPLVDKDIYQHVGKSISVSSAIFSENKASSNSNLPNLTILPGKPASAKLTVTGQAKVNVKVHYKDDQGNDHYVDLPDQAKTYHEGQDIMKPEDFMTKNSDLTDADRILLPAGIVINWAAGPTIQNSDAQYAAGYQNGTAAFDQTVAPDFDGDTLIYEGAFAKPVTDTHKVTRTIKFVDQNGKQIYPDVAQHSIEFTRSGFEDPFTHKIAWVAIPGSDILPQYQVPKIDGYTPDKSQVAQATVKYGDADSAITVTYKANAQVIKVNFIDDITGKTLDSKSLDGVSDADANYNTKVDINNYEKQHYVLVSDSSDGQDLIFDHDDQATQSYDVHFTHDTNPDSRQDTVTRTITYTGAGNKTPSAVTQSVHFTQAGTKDLVTGKTKWNDVADQNFASVGTPEVAGYTPDKSQVAQATVKYGDKDTTVTVTYAADKQQAKLRFYDDTAKKFIDAAPVLDASGKTDGQVGFTIPNSYDFSKYNFVNVTKGADPESTDQLASADLSAVQYGKYDTDDKKDQVFVAHFTHKIKAINEKVTVNETIHYVYEDGSKAHDDYQATPLVFTKTGTKDLVTGEEKATWTKSQKFAEVASPEIPGYTPDQAVIPAVEVAHGDNDVVRTVTYSKNIEPQEPTTPTDNPVTPKAPEEPQQPATPDDNPDVVRPHSGNSPQKKQDSKQTNKTTEVNKTVKRSSTVKPKATATTKRNGTKVQLATKDASKQSNPKAVVNSTSTTVVNNKGEKKAETLPQTGEKDNKLGILGLLTLSLASLFGFSEKKKKED